MTDEQIEKQLERSANNGVGFHAEVLDYINYLKLTIDRLKKNWNSGVAIQRTFWRKKVAKARKETAKEVLQKLLSWKSSVIFDTENVAVAEKTFEDSIKALAVEEYGLEIDK